MEKIYILGESSFVGKSLFKFLEKKVDCYLISKNKIDFLDSKTYSNLDFNNSIIIDCINVNNGNEKEIMDCNFYGFQSFCNYLLSTTVNFKYVYISTISVLSEDSVKSSAYVRSKKMSEEYLINSPIEHQIIRLSYPIGKGENPNRLISSLISKLKLDEKIVINNVRINLNDIHDVVLDIYLKLFKSKQTFISNNIYLDLSEITFFLKDILKSKSEIIVNAVNNNFEPKSESPFVQNIDIKKTLIKMI